MPFEDIALVDNHAHPLLRPEAAESSTAPAHAAPAPQAPVSRWPFFYAWLVVAAAAWWGERRVRPA